VFHLDVAKIDIVLHILQYIGPTCCRHLLQLLGRRRVGTDSSACMRVGSGEGTSGPRVRLGYARHSGNVGLRIGAATVPSDGSVGIIFIMVTNVLPSVQPRPRLMVAKS
jgi:hypothetical protein